MNARYHIGSLLLIMSIILIGIAIVGSNSSTNRLPQLPEVLSTSQDITKKTPSHITFSGYVSIEHETDVLSTLSTSSGIIKTLIPSWYELTREGDIDVVYSTQKAEIIQYAKESHIALMPSLSDYSNASNTSTLLSSPTLQKQLIQQLKETAKTQTFEGFTISFLDVQPERGEDFTAFIKHLHTALSADDKKLYVTLPPKTGKEIEGDTIMSYDWAALGQIADGLFIQTFHPVPPTPKSQPPSHYLNDIIAYAKTTIPSEKITLVLKSTGTYMSERESKELSYDDITTILKNTSSPLVRDPESGVLNAAIGQEKNRQYIFFDDAQSLFTKIEIIEIQGIRNISFSNIGSEDTTIWRMVQL